MSEPGISLGSVDFLALFKDQERNGFADLAGSNDSGLLHVAAAFPEISST